MANQRRAFDWQVFWLGEVLVLSLPFLIAVFTLPRGSHIERVRLEVLLSIQLGLTILNVFWTLVASARSEKLASTKMAKPAHSSRYPRGPKSLGLDLQEKPDSPTAKFPVNSEFGPSMLSDSGAKKEAGLT